MHEMTENATAQEVSVIGLGAMGAALAMALLAGNHRVTVWNRSASKCVPFGKAGARIANSVAEAVDASRVVVVCVLDYAASDALLHTPDVAARLNGKTLIQLTTGTLQEVQEAGAWAKEHGVAYLDGTVEGYPQHVGTPDGMILYAGARSTFDAMQPVLASLSGHAFFTGEEFGTAAVLDGAVIGSFSLIATLGFLYGAALCDAEGVSLDTYLSIALARLPFIADNLRMAVPMIEKGDYSGREAALDTWVVGITKLVEHSRAIGMDSGLSQEVLARLQQAITMGHGQHELAAVFECFRKLPVSN